MSKSWLYDSSNSNIFKQSYMKDFLDISGDLYIRNGNLIATDDISMNGNVSCNEISLTVPFSSSGINSDVSGALALKQNTLTAGSGITIDGTTINASSDDGISTISSETVAGTLQINIASDLNVSGTLNVSGDLTHNGQLLHTSDDRLKDNEERIENALEILDKLKPSKYIRSNVLETGFIVQDIWYNVPELRYLVNTNAKENIQETSNYTYDMNMSEIGWSDEPSQLNYTGLMGHVVKGIKELDTLLENNKTQITNL